MTHGVFAEAMRDAMVFAALIIGGTFAMGFLWDLVCWIAGEIRRAVRRRAA